MKWEGRPSTEGEDGGGCQRPESSEDIIVAGQGNARSIKGFLKLVTMKWDTQQDCDFLQPCSAPWAVLRVGGESSLNRIGFCQTMTQEVWILAWIQFSSYMTSMAQRLTFYICKTGKMSVPTPEKLVVKFKWISSIRYLGSTQAVTPVFPLYHKVNMQWFLILYSYIAVLERVCGGREEVRNNSFTAMIKINKKRNRAGSSIKRKDERQNQCSTCELKSNNISPKDQVFWTLCECV